MNRRTADRVQLIDSDCNPVEIERRPEWRSLSDKIKNVFFYILLMSIGGGFIFMALIAFFGGVE